MAADRALVRRFCETYPLRTGLLVGLPVGVAAIEGYLSLTDHHHVVVGLGFAALLLAYSAGVTRLHLARHRIDHVETSGGSAGSASHPNERR